MTNEDFGGPVISPKGMIQVEEITEALSKSLDWSRLFDYRVTFFGVENGYVPETALTDPTTTHGVESVSPPY